MPSRRSPLDKALDLVLFAPLGLAMNLGELLPELAEKGRQQITVARMLGEMALTQGQVEAEKALRRTREQAEAALGVRSGGPAETPPAPARAVPASSPGPGPLTEVRPSPAVARPVPAQPRPAPTASPPEPAAAGNGQAPVTETRPEASSLAIPGYDNLSASQVVQRLAGLSAGELEAVRRYEDSGRARKTVLARVAQLQTLR